MESSRPNSDVNLYRITGTSQSVGAIGVPIHFSKLVQANSPRSAVEKLRESFYANNREHVHVRLVEVNTNYIEWARVASKDWA